jgi:hypothetical protein
MQGTICRILVLTITLLGGKADGNPDFVHGARLHRATCTKCHGNMTGGDGSPLYMRSDRRVHSMKQLEHQVRLCAAEMKLLWSDEDFADVVHYLNKRYYGFDK